MCVTCTILYLLGLISCTTKAINFQSLDILRTAEIINGDVFFEILDPPELEYTYRLRPAKDFGASFNNLQLEDIALVPAVPDDACGPLVNAEQLNGAVALVERGECSFLAKTINVERAGALAVIVTESSTTKIAEGEDELYIEMIDDDSGDEASIPAGFLLRSDGRVIKSTLRKLRRNYALITIPKNLTFTPPHEINSPPWTGL